MFLHLPDRIFFESEIRRRLIQQNKGGWDWTFDLIPNDQTLKVSVTGNKINQFNYISIGTDDRTNRKSSITVKLKSEGKVLYTYEHELDLIFEENLSLVDTYYPQLRHFEYGSTNFKLNLIKLSDKEPSVKIDMSNWCGMQSIGLAVKDQPTTIEIPIDNFTNKNEWKYAVLWGHWIGDGATLVYRNVNKAVKPITYTYKYREIEVVLKPNESLFYHVKGSNTYSGFGITSIRFYK